MILLLAEVHSADKSVQIVGSECHWCGQAGKLPYVLPLKSGRRTFCSEACLFEFRKGACAQCSDVIQGPPFQITKNSAVRDFCSEKCLNKYKKKEEGKQVKPTSTGEPKTGALAPNPMPVPMPRETLLNGAASAASALLNCSSFSWQEYLKETGSSPAASSCFKQVIARWFTFLQLPR